MTSDEAWNQFLKALSELQKQNDLILRDMITTFIKEKFKNNDNTN